MEENIELALLEAVWLMRWNKNKTAKSAVLTTEEAEQMCKDIVEELDKAGYEIVRKAKKSVCGNCNTEVEPIPLGHMCPNCACDM